jgi:predicted NAD-dependent protein-ADP-ribosyltransferase YbiA (DUF1768 family)
MHVLLFSRTAKKLSSPPPGIHPETPRMLSPSSSGSPFPYDGIVYPTTEHAFYAQQALYATPPRPELRQVIADSTTPAKAARDLGLTMNRGVWGRMSRFVMKEVLRQKIIHTPAVSSAIGYCREHHIPIVYTGDKAWGAVYNHQTGKIASGHNILGALYTELASELNLKGPRVTPMLITPPLGA